MDSSILLYGEEMDEIDCANRDAVVDYQVGMWRLPSGSAHDYDEEAIRAMARENSARTDNMVTSFNHGALSGGDAWLGRLEEIAAPALIIDGMEDPVLPYAHGLTRKASLRNFSLVTLLGTGHELHRNDWPTNMEAIERHTSQRPIARADVHLSQAWGQGDMARPVLSSSNYPPRRGNFALPIASGYCRFF